MTDLLALAERCEQATGPDRDIDIMIADACPPYRRFALPYYTASIDAAMQLVPEGWAIFIERAPNHWRCSAIIGEAPDGGEWRAGGATVALALTAAALKSRARSNSLSQTGSDDRG